MKPRLLSSLSFLLFSLTTHFSFSFTQDIIPVIDTDGNPLVPGAKYYILPALPGREGCGGLRLGKTSGKDGWDTTLYISHRPGENFVISKAMMMLLEGVWSP
ncbi:hypothetical protein TSUD_294270 [Trifolium subterraneum]|uniref:Uncharacterized protein n=1 Tax=Trifolium subterraneum TaxID=3900 RepID=A0A2Z6M2W4_TRISU|nr:hypothetical protein TSUD_294270 [Trifolium subterraneum]